MIKKKRFGTLDEAVVAVVLVVVVVVVAPTAVEVGAVAVAVGAVATTAPETEADSWPQTGTLGVSASATKPPGIAISIAFLFKNQIY